MTATLLRALILPAAAAFLAAAPAAHAAPAAEQAKANHPKPRVGAVCPRLGRTGVTAKGVRVRCALRSGRLIWVRARPVVRVATPPPAAPAPPAPAPAPPPPPPPGATRENPIPFGQTHVGTDGWAITVVGVVRDATAQVLAQNMFNDPPAAGKQFLMVRVSATYTGPGSSRFDGSFRLRAVGPSAVAYTTFNDWCGVIPDEVPEAQVFTGGTIGGNVCWQVTSSDAAGLVMFDDPLFGRAQTFFALP